MQSPPHGTPFDHDKLIDIFNASLEQFFEHETLQVLQGVNERSSCARLAVYLQRIAEQAGLDGYFVDAEYNRMQEGKIKTILDDNETVVRINCDLILHGRGNRGCRENLIAVEMKKDGRPISHYEKDRRRLRALTKDPDSAKNQVWAIGKNVDYLWPQHVCGYILGAFVLLDRPQRTCTIDYFAEGSLVSSRQRKF
jgi:hypothetical protein